MTLEYEASVHKQLARSLKCLEAWVALHNGQLRNGCPKGYKQADTLEIAQVVIGLLKALLTACLTQKACWIADAERPSGFPLYNILCTLT